MNSEQQYLEVLRELLQRGDYRNTRNAKVLSCFGHMLTFDLSEGFPLLTTKKVFFKGIVTELAWFLRGDTNVRLLHEHNNHIWDGNTKELDFDAGPVYGYQWRHFGAGYTDCHADYTGKGVDQIASIISLIKEDPTSRRIILTAWNPLMQNEMCLPPCHMTYQFYVKDGKLNVLMHQRSSDVFLGLPFNIASTALFVHLLAHETDLEVGIVKIALGDYHLYETHIGVATIQMNRVPYQFPKLTINREKDGLKDVKLNEISLSEYRHHPALRAKMIS